MESIIRQNAASQYVLTIGTCGVFAPGWVAQTYHHRPMWLMHCPGLPATSVEGCDVFLGLIEVGMNSRCILHESDTAGTIYLTWRLGASDHIAVPVDSDLLASLANADAGEGEILIAFVGADVCRLQSVPIDQQLVNWIGQQQQIFTTPEPDNSENGFMHRRIAERAIVTRLHEFARPELVCRVDTRGREQILSYLN